jgi:hypothetical protein
MGHVHPRFSILLLDPVSGASSTFEVDVSYWPRISILVFLSSPFLVRQRKRPFGTWAMAPTVIPKVVADIQRPLTGDQVAIYNIPTALHPVVYILHRCPSRRRLEDSEIPLAPMIVDHLSS